MDTPELTLPHPRFRERAFVLAPLAEIARMRRIRCPGKTVAELLGLLRTPTGRRQRRRGRRQGLLEPLRLEPKRARTDSSRVQGHAMRDRITPVSFRRKMEAGEKIAVLTAYDFPGARAGRRGRGGRHSGGGLRGMAVMGLRLHLPVTMDVMHHHTAMVARAVSRALVVADLPFLSYHNGRGGRRAQRGPPGRGRRGATPCKLEGPADQFAG
jgi:hypothetical protein